MLEYELHRLSDEFDSSYTVLLQLLNNVLAFPLKMESTLLFLGEGVYNSLIYSLLKPLMSLSMKNMRIVAARLQQAKSVKV